MPLLGFAQVNTATSDDMKTSVDYPLWDLGIWLGFSQNGSDTQSWGMDGESILNQSNLAYGLNLTRNLNDNLGLRLNFWRSKIEGHDMDIDNEFATGHDARGFSFESDITEISLVGKYNFLGHDDSWTPYIFGGLGVSFTSPEVDYNNSATVNINRADAIANDILNTGSTYLQIPIGIGVQFDLSEKISLGLEASSRVPLGDYLDGISEAANPDKNDSYQFIGVNLGIGLQGEDNDFDDDGYKNNVDACPNVPGSLNGCPDIDADGIADSEDECPNLFGIPAFNGCPDSDNDGIADKFDRCPEVPGTRAMNGCADSDGDGIADNLDKCPDEKGVASNDGCPDNDSDNDGFANDVDDCPTVKGTLNGCPDTDNDKIADASDPCPNLYGTVNGCPDSDKDGVADNVDRCPNRAGDKSNGGCPKVVTTTVPASTTTINNYRIRDIHFLTNSAGLTDESKIRVDEIISFASQYPNAYFHIAGYTDNIGASDSNQRLSERRAKMVYDKLISRGISADRLSYSGYGETDFIDTNDTDTGRYNNRRVEVRASTTRR